jgi:hypothetical protein
MHHTMHLRPGVAKQPNLELKTRPKQLLGSLPLVMRLPAKIGLLERLLGTNTLAYYPTASVTMKEVIQIETRDHDPFSS